MPREHEPCGGLLYRNSRSMEVKTGLAQGSRRPADKAMTTKGATVKEQAELQPRLINVKRPSVILVHTRTCQNLFPVTVAAYDSLQIWVITRPAMTEGGSRSGQRGGEQSTGKTIGIVYKYISVIHAQ
jgi:hypothetical protein